MRRSERDTRFDATDVLAAVAGGVFGLAIGFVAGSNVGRVNARRITGAFKRWKDGRPSSRVWTLEEAERLEARVLDALSRDVVLARRRIRVAVLGMGLVELTGAVLRTPEVGLAGDIAQRVHGVQTVLNHLLVESADRPAVGVGGPDTPRAARG